MPEADPSNGSEQPTPPAGAPVGPVTVQVSPQGHVTITVNPPFTMPDLVNLQSTNQEAFSLFGGGGDEQGAASPFKPVLDKLRSAIETLGDKIVEFTTGVATLEVRTYVSERIEDVRPDGAIGFTHAQQRAMTYVKFDGDTQVVVPIDAGQIDEALWQIHLQTVEQAQAHRQAMLKTVGELVAGFIPAIK